jgi:hypothetical protein
VQMKGVKKKKGAHMLSTKRLLDYWLLKENN